MKRPDTGRIWAWVALVAAAGVLTTLAILLAGDVVALLLVLAALGLVGAGVWIATTRRGVARRFGFGVAIVALAGGVVALVWQDVVGELVAPGGRDRRVRGRKSHGSAPTARSREN
jgi:hypothetical protein